MLRVTSICIVKFYAQKNWNLLQRIDFKYRHWNCKAAHTLDWYWCLFWVMCVMLEVELVSTTDGAFYKASEVVILEQLWAGALFKHILARIHTTQRQEIPFNTFNMYMAPLLSEWKGERVPTNNIADGLFSERNETPVEHVRITIKKGFLLWRTHCSYKKHFYCWEHTVPQGSYVMRSPRYKATDCTLYVDTQVYVHVWKICKRRLTKHNTTNISLSASLFLLFTPSSK